MPEPGRNPPPAVPFRWLIVAAIWFMAAAPILIGVILGLIVAGTTGLVVGAVIGVLFGIFSYLIAARALERAERR